MGSFCHTQALRTKVLSGLGVEGQGLSCENWTPVEVTITTTTPQEPKEENPRGDMCSANPI